VQGEIPVLHMNICGENRQPSPSHQTLPVSLNETKQTIKTDLNGTENKITNSNVG
jgi:hypothetical protein